MNILISNEQKTVDLDERFLRILRGAAGFVLEVERAGENIELSIAFVEENEIRNLNKRYRGKDAPTDVLSFEIDSEMGDIIICPSVAMRQAVEYGQTFVQEMKLLLIHGILHLLGYDHIKDSEAEIMENREREILEELSRERSIDTISSNEGTGGNG